MHKKLNIIIFGTGGYYQKYKNRFTNCNILALLDNAKEKQGQLIDGKEVIAITDIYQYEYDYIVILIHTYEDIVLQLKNVGITEDKIITPNSEGKFNSFRQVKRTVSENTADILLVSHEMNMRGAPLILFEMAKILKSNGKTVEVATTTHGALYQYYEEENIPILEFDDFFLTKEDIIKYFGVYKLIIVNTLALSDLISKLDILNKNIIWWLHEEWSAYPILKPNTSINFKNKKLHIYGVGNRAIQSFKDYYGYNKEIQNLQWGIPYVPALNNNHNEKTVFAVIGPVCKIKGQDILLKVVKENFKGILSNIELWIIGHITEYDKKTFEEFDCIKVFGEINHVDMMKLYQHIDVVLSTSRNDTMPIVLVEGMMNKKICMTSNGTGVSDYIINHQNGIVFESENALNLSEEIYWLLTHKSQWKDIQTQAHKLYLNKYSLTQFENCIMELISDYM